MRSAFAVTVAAALVVSSRAAHNGTASMSMPMYATEVVTAYTTFCPQPTTIAYNNVTYTITEATTFTITDCPCTVIAPIHVSTVTDCTTCPDSSTVVTSIATSPVLVTETPVAPVGTGSGPIYGNSTAPITAPRPTTVESKGVSGTSPIVPLATGAANKAFVASGATLAGLVGLAAFAL